MEQEAPLTSDSHCLHIVSTAAVRHGDGSQGNGQDAVRGDASIHGRVLWFVMVVL